MTQTTEPDAQKTLYNILVQERAAGFRNTVVIGGLDGFLQRYLGELQPLLEGLSSYATLAPEERERWADQVAKGLRSSVSSTKAHRATGPASPDKSGPVARPPRSVHGSGSASPEPLALDDEVERLKGVAGRTVPRLKRMEIEMVRDLIFHFPHRHNDYGNVRKIDRLVPGEEQTVLARVVRAEETRSGGRRRSTQAVLEDETGEVRAIWFNNRWLAGRLKPGVRLAVSGKATVFRGRFVFESPDYELLDARQDDLVHTGRIVPVYAVTDGLYQRQMRSLVKQAMDRCLPQIDEFLPDEVRRRAGLIAIRDAILQIHYPESIEDWRAARRRLAFDELFMIQLAVVRQKRLWREEGAGTPLPARPAALKAFLGALPFTLTDAQATALDEVLSDTESDRPMRRLLQGDVGSGKTVVAAAAMVVAVENGKKAALMVPTEILAEQHFMTISRLVAGADLDPDGEPVVTLRVAGMSSPMVLGLLLGSQTKRVKDGVRAMLAQGVIDIVIGTHALIQEGVEIDDLALVVVDEQHRFGVLQRASIGDKGQRPHVLAMSATPIPRSLALTVYGDLDISAIDQLPPGRLAVRTRWVESTRREAAYEFVRKQVEEGRQAFIVCPLVEESEVVQSRAAVKEHDRLSEQVFPELRVGLLHGRMSLKGKELVMEGFQANDLDILVATAVVEVGIDIPNASVMLIDGADRFGLSQLHQFRGRVGRSEHQSYCLLLSDAPGEEAQKRLKLLERVGDGFQLAEEDLKMRGPGDYLGTRQSGMPTLRVARITDHDILALARREATTILDEDPALSGEKHSALAMQLSRHTLGLTPEAS